MTMNPDVAVELTTEQQQLKREIDAVCSRVMASDPNSCIAYLLQSVTVDRATSTGGLDCHFGLPVKCRCAPSAPAMLRLLADELDRVPTIAALIYSCDRAGRFER